MSGYNGWVYYLKVGKHIKIGYAADVKARLAGYPPETELLAVEPGSLVLEKERLLMFASHLEWGNEWFTPCPELSVFIATIRRENGIPAGMAHEYTRPGQSRVTKRVKAIAPSLEWITIAEAAAIVNVSTKTIRRWITAGLIDARRFGPSLIRIDPTSLNAMGRKLMYVDE